MSDLRTGRLYTPGNIPGTHFWVVVVDEVKVKQSLYRSGLPLRVPGGWGSQISWQSAHEGGKVVRPTHWLPLPPRKYSWYSFPGCGGDELFWTAVRMHLVLDRRRLCCKVQTETLEGIQGGMLSVLPINSARVTDPQRIHRFVTHNAAHKPEGNTRVL